MSELAESSIQASLNGDSNDRVGNEASDNTGEGSSSSFGTAEVVQVHDQQGQIKLEAPERFFAVPGRQCLDTIEDFETSRSRYSSPSFDRPIAGWADPPNEKFDCQTSWFDHKSADCHGREPTWSEYIEQGGLADAVWEERERKKIRRRKTRNVTHWIRTGNPLGVTTEKPDQEGSSSACQLTTGLSPSRHISYPSQTAAARLSVPESTQAQEARKQQTSAATSAVGPAYESDLGSIPECPMS